MSGASAYERAYARLMHRFGLLNSTRAMYSPPQIGIIAYETNHFHNSCDYSGQLRRKTRWRALGADSPSDPSSISR